MNLRNHHGPFQCWLNPYVSRISGLALDKWLPPLVLGGHRAGLVSDLVLPRLRLNSWFRNKSKPRFMASFYMTASFGNLFHRLACKWSFAPLANCKFTAIYFTLLISTKALKLIPHLLLHSAASIIYSILKPWENGKKMVGLFLLGADLHVGWIWQVMQDSPFPRFTLTLHTRSP